MDPDPYWIRVRIGIQPKMLDTDPDEMNADPQPWLLVRLPAARYRALAYYPTGNVSEHSNSDERIRNEAFRKCSPREKSKNREYKNLNT